QRLAGTAASRGPWLQPRVARGDPLFATATASPLPRSLHAARGSAGARARDPAFGDGHGAAAREALEGPTAETTGRIRDDPARVVGDGQLDAADRRPLEVLERMGADLAIG